MSKFFYRILADAVWLAHFVVVCIALFGWLFPALWFLYIATLVGVLVSTLTLGYCILSKWEYDLRKKSDSSVQYDFSYASYYTYRLTRGHLSGAFLKWTGVMYSALALGVSIYFRYFYL